MIKRTLIPAAWNKYEDSIIFRCSESQREYQRIVGGMMWPGKQPGFAIVLGQARWPNPQTKVPDLWICAEKQEASVQDLLAVCARWMKDYCCDKWYGHRDDFGMGRILCRFNETRPRHPVQVIPAMGEEEQDELQFYVDLIRIAISSSKKVLQLHGSTLGEKMMEMDPDYHKKDCTDYPAIAALGFALSAMEMYRGGKAKYAGAYEPLDKVFGY